MIKKLVSMALAFTMMFAFTACSSQTDEEKAVIGLWNATHVQMGEEMSVLPSAYCALEVKKDNTASISISNNETGGADVEQLTWETSETTEGGMYTYVFTNSAGGTLAAAYSRDDNALVVISSEESSIIFEKVK
ncbi:MAG: hypothetical protein IJD80_03550 [Oscillospiraceae bacterium]|nr:hypothetical protein [Oscillospiraceae bacterium]